MNLFGQELTRCLLSVSLLTFSFATLHATDIDIDLAASKITVHVEKSGMFAAFAHNHVISAPLASGHLDLEKRTIELKFRSRDMKVMDPDVSDSDRAEIERTMKSDKVLDVDHFPEISFASTSVESSEAGSDSAKQFVVHGNLTLHGVTKPIDLPVSFSNGRYTGKVTLKQTDYGITPIKIAGGSVKVKDPIEIIFEIAPQK
jgi:polyisoprenoid-binding protein YceI